MARRVRDYSSDNSKVTSIGAVAGGGGFKHAMDLPMHPVSSRLGAGRMAPMVNPSASSVQSSNVSGTKMNMMAPVSSMVADGDMIRPPKGPGQTRTI